MRYIDIQVGTTQAHNVEISELGNNTRIADTTHITRKTQKGAKPEYSKIIKDHEDQDTYLHMRAALVFLGLQCLLE